MHSNNSTFSGLEDFWSKELDDCFQRLKQLSSGSETAESKWKEELETLTITLKNISEHARTCSSELVTLRKAQKQLMQEFENSFASTQYLSPAQIRLHLQAEFTQFQNTQAEKFSVALQAFMETESRLSQKIATLAMENSRLRSAINEIVGRK